MNNFRSIAGFIFVKIFPKSFAELSFTVRFVSSDFVMTT